MDNVLDSSTPNNYAYVDKYGELHVVTDRKTALQYSVDGFVVDTTIPCQAGFAESYDGEKIFYNVWDNIGYIGGNSINSGTKYFIRKGTELDRVVNCLTTHKAQE